MTNSQFKWSPVTVEERGNVWMDFKSGDYVVAQGFCENDKKWSLFCKKRWLADFDRIADAKKAAEAMMKGDHVDEERNVSGSDRGR
jgi:hypothetical protein